LWFFFQGIESTVATAGFSVGEFAAMVFAEVMSFEDGEIIYIYWKEIYGNQLSSKLRKHVFHIEC
jgi:hypothetical protein